MNAPNNFRVFDSIHDFTRSDVKWLSRYENNLWAGGRNNADSLTYFEHGAETREVDAARALVDKVDIELHGMQGEVWTPQVYGAYPVVPDYLAGDPHCMRSRELQESQLAPVRVVLNVAVSSGVGAHTIAHRAAAAAAFAMKLGERRPVELWAAAACHNEQVDRDVGFRIKLDSPVNLSQVIAAFHPSVARCLACSAIDSLSTDNSGQSTNFAGEFKLQGYELRGNRDKYMEAFRRYQGLSGDDLVLDAGHLLDADEIDGNPAAWVKKMLLMYGFETDTY